MTVIRRSIIIIFAAILCLIIWYIGPLVAIGDFHPFTAVWIRVLLISIILIFVLWPVFVVFLSFLLQYFLKPFAKKKVKPKKELDVVTSRFQDTVATLKVSTLDSKKSKFEELVYKINKPYLEDRPWILLLGAPSVGKTSLLNTSGEHFLHSEHYGFGETANVGPTDVYNSWISDRAIYFDTSPEWLRLDGQQEESVNHIKTFFKLVKKYRPSAPLDGIVLAVSADWLRKASVNEIKAFSDSLRVRLLEITKTLSQDLPVYLFITKIDLLPGAKEFMYLFNSEIIHNGIGLSAPPINADGRPEDYFKVFSKRYDDWLTKLTDYLLEILHDSLDNNLRNQLFEFVELIGSLKEPILNLSEKIFPNYPTGYSCYLYDIWFGSAISLRINKEDEYSNKYLGELYYPALTRVIKSRGLLDNITSNKKIRLNRKRILKYFLIGLFTIFALFILATKYFKEVDYISFVTEKFKDTKRIVKEVPLSNEASDELLYAYAQLDYINSQLYKSESNDYLNNYFDFSHDRTNPYVEHIFINETLNKTYHNHLLKFFWPAITNYVTDQLAKEIQSNSPNIYSTLKIYQMFIKPDHRSSQELIVWFMKRWDSFAPSGYTNLDKKTFAFHLKSLFDDKFPSGIPTFKANPTLVNMAIFKASGISMTNRVIDKIKEYPIPKNVIGISLVRAAGNNASLMLKHKNNKSIVDISIPAFYTKGAYKDLFLEKLDPTIDEIINETSWVLDDITNEHATKSETLAFKQKLKADAMQFYLISFTKEWMNFINNITIRPVKNLEDTAFLAKQLSDPSSPVVNLVRFLYLELNLTGTAEGTTGGWFERNYTSNIRKKKQDILSEISGQRNIYRHTPERMVEDQFRSLLEIGRTLVSTTDIEGNQVSKLFDDVYNLIYPLAIAVKNDPSASSQQETVFGQIKAKTVSLPEPLKSILLNLISDSQTEAIQAININMDNKLTSMFTTTCQTSIKSKYPFNKRSNSDVAITDFNRIFAPNGELDQFFKENNIYQLVEQQGIKENKGNFSNSKIMRTYKDYINIKNAFFTNGNEMNLHFDVKPVSLSNNVFLADIDIDGQKIKYSHGYPTVTSVTWPGQSKANTVRVVFQTNDGLIKIKNFNGPWALFKLIDQSKIVRSGPNYKVVSFSIEDNYTITLEIKSDMVDFPLWNNSIKTFSCP